MTLSQTTVGDDVVAEKGRPFGVTQELSNLYRRVILRTIPFILFCYVISYVDRVNISFAKLQFQADIQLSDASYGLGVGIFYVGYLLFEVPSNLILHRFGARATLARIMCLWGVVSIGMAFVSNPLQFYLARILLGAAEAGFFPGVILYLTYWFPDQLRGRVMSYFVLGISISGMVGGPLSGFIIHHFDGLHGFRGWQWLFLVEGALPILCGILAYFILSDRPRDAGWLTEDEKRIILSNLSTPKTTQHSGLSAFLLALRDPRLWLATVGFYATVSSGIILNFWTPSILQRSGISDVLMIGLLSGVPPIIGAVGMVLICRSSDRMLERRWHFTGAGLLATAAVLLIPVASSSSVASILCLAGIAVGYYSATSILWTLPPGFLSASESAGGIAFISAVGGLGALVTPPVFGWLNTVTGTFTAGSCYVAVVLIAGIVSIRSIRISHVSPRTPA
jgi:ACS family phthalate transporter-like MFS transporter